MARRGMRSRGNHCRENPRTNELNRRLHPAASALPSPCSAQETRPLTSRARDVRIFSTPPIFSDLSLKPVAALFTQQRERGGGGPVRHSRVRALWAKNPLTGNPPMRCSRSDGSVVEEARSSAQQQERRESRPGDHRKGERSNSRPALDDSEF